MYKKKSVVLMLGPPPCIVKPIENVGFSSLELQQTNYRAREISGPGSPRWGPVCSWWNRETYESASAFYLLRLSHYFHVFMLERRLLDLEVIEEQWTNQCAGDGVRSVYRARSNEDASVWPPVRRLCKYFLILIIIFFDIAEEVPASKRNLYVYIVLKRFNIPFQSQIP